MTCPICNLELSFEEKFMYPIEVPYCNMWIHKSCKDSAFNIIRENPQIVYNYLVIKNKNKK